MTGFFYCIGILTCLFVSVFIVLIVAIYVSDMITTIGIHKKYKHIHCFDCKYYKYLPEEGWMCSRMNCSKVNKNDFCSIGERREENGY